MVDRFDCLRHNTVIGSYYQDSDICYLCTTHTHCCERFVTGCIQESDGFAIDLYCVSTDMLCDTACFAFCYVRMTDRIQQGCFTMVNVAHYYNYGRSFFQFGFVFFLFCTESFFHDVFFFFQFQDHVVFFSDRCSCIEIQCCIDRQHFTFFHQVHYQVRTFFAQQFSQIFHCDGLRDVFDNRISVCCCFCCFQSCQFSHQRCFFFHFTASAFHRVFFHLLVVVFAAFFIFAFVVIFILGFSALLLTILFLVVLLLGFTLSVVVSVILFLCRSVVIATLFLVFFLTILSGCIFFRSILFGRMLFGCVFFRSFFLGFFFFRLIQCCHFRCFLFSQHTHVVFCFDTNTVNFF